MNSQPQWNETALAGQQRIVIRRVSPELDVGQFPVRAAPGDVIAVEADIFADGSDALAARLLYRHSADATWNGMAMAPLGNDRWGASFIADKPGRYSYVIEAWIDLLASWQQVVHQKLAAGERIERNLQTGARYVDAMLVQAGGKPEPQKAKPRRTKKSPDPADEPADVRSLRTMAALFRDETRYDEAVSLAASEQVMFYASRYPDRLNVTRYALELVVNVVRDKVNFSTWYCLFPRSTSREEGKKGTLRSVETLLPRISGMGFDVLCLPPIHPIGHTSRRGKNKSAASEAGDPGDPYCVGGAEGGHDTIHPELGTVDDLKHLMAIAANYDMELALDLSLLCSPDHPWVGEHPDWFRGATDDGVPFDFNTDDWQNLWDALKRVLLLWGEWGIRIIRVDKPQDQPFMFWEWVIAEVKQYYPDMLFVAAGFCRPSVMQELAMRGFDQSYTPFMWRNGKNEIQNLLTELTREELKGYLRPSFWPATYDILPYALQGGHEPQFMIRYFLAATLSGNYGIYGPAFELMEHQPMPNKEEYLNAEQYEIREWDWDRTNKLTYLMGLINRIRRENPALQQTGNLTFCTVSDDAIMAYLKTAGDNQLLIVVNTDAYNRRAAMVQVPIWELGLPHGHTYQVHDLITDAYYTWEGEWNYVELDPYTLPMHLLRIER